MNSYHSWLSLITLHFLFIFHIKGQEVPYGNNPAAGAYVNTGDAKIYYEVYGKGEPFVMLHGGVYGYIDEFAPFIPKLAEKYQVICIATRGHGKSEIGNKKVTYQLRAEDAFQVINHVTKDSVILLGFSDGGYSAMKFASLYPGKVKKMIVMGAADRSATTTRKKINYTPEMLMRQDSAFFAGRLKLMPEPERWGESLRQLSLMYQNEVMSEETFRKIKCPVLLMSGDRDDNFQMEDVIKAARYLKNAHTAIIGGCHHVIFFCNFPAVWEGVRHFLAEDR